MNKMTRAACAGMVLLGAVGCSAEAQVTPTPTVTISPPIPTTTISVLPRQNVDVTVAPRSLVGGASKNVRVTAFCPSAQPGTTYRANARSDAFTGIVSLLPPVVATPADTTSVQPSVTGVAVLRATARAGGYKVEVRCEATNDTGDATLRVTRPVTTENDDIPTKAPGTGGGGMAAGGPEDESSGIPTPVTVIALLAVLGVGVGVARRRSSG